MRTTLRKIGNAHGALIPKALLAQTGIDQAVELTVEDGAIANEDALTKTQRHKDTKKKREIRSHERLLYLCVFVSL